MTGRLTTHVLDLSKGSPAEGVQVQLWQPVSGSGKLLREAVTNADGRLDGPLLEGASMLPGTYELLFLAGEYFRGEECSKCEADGETSFLDQIPIRFQIGDTAAHYHVPLLVAPGGYSTYRGS